MKKMGVRGMKSPRGLKPNKPIGSQSSGRATSPAGGGAGPLKITAPKNLDAFTHKTPTFKTLTTDRGAFRIKV